MARQIIDIGVEGNDGTGDSLRESFRKSNENFQELYAVFGQGGQIGFLALGDTPDSYVNQAGKVAVVKQTEDGVELLELASNGALSGDADDDTVQFNFTEEGKLILTTSNSRINQDPAPQLGGAFDANGNAIANVAISDDAAAAWVGKHGGNITIDDLVADKKYNDQNYLKRGSAGKTANLRDEPANASEYTFTISALSTQLTIGTHGLDTSSNGAPYIYESTGTDANNLTDGSTYYLRVVDPTKVTLHPTADDAKEDTNAIIATGGTGTQTLTDASYDSNLTGFWLDNEALPRKSVVRRQGDTMSGPLFLNDHPGELEGTGAPNGATDYQAVTKYYVDNATFTSTKNLYVSTQGDDRQVGTPSGKEGRSYSYAFRTINKACELAEEIILSSPIEPGPYMQTITHSDTAEASITTSVGLSTSISGRDNVKTVIEGNRTFIQEEVIAYIDQTYTDFEYDSAICKRDIGLILDSIVLDVLSGNNANYLSRYAGLRYYSSASGKRAITTQLTETVAGINRARSLVTQILNGATITALQDNYDQTLYPAITIDATSKASVDAKFDVVIDVINDGPLDAPTLVDGATYEIAMTNGGNGNVDQGVSINTDIRNGKVVRGKTSGAIGRIVVYSRETDSPSNPSGNDVLQVVLLEPVEFIAGEELEYGNQVNPTQITIFVESGIYYEDFPIRVSDNVSIKGDEFRRTIVRPKNRRSQSRFANQYFYRDKQFDNLTGDSSSITGYPDTNLPVSGTPYINPLTGELDGYFGYHYLVDPTAPMNLGTDGINNAGGYDEAAELLRRNRAFVIEEVIEYIEATYPSLVYDQSKCRRDTGYIIDGIVLDLITGGRANSLKNQGEYYGGVVIGQETETEAAIDYIKTIADDVLANTAFSAKLGSVDQYIDTDFISEAGAQTALESLVDCVTFAFDPSYNPAKNNLELDVFMMNDATILRNLTVQGQGGFMCVLDPEGQVLTKSPYIQTGSAFSQSINRQAFRGGMFVDAYTGNVPMEVYEITSAFEVKVRSQAGEGLFQRRPATPAPFYIDGIRFQVNEVRFWDKTAGTAILLLDETSNTGTGWSGITSSASTGVDLDSADTNNPVVITVQTGGNRSMLGNDFTQINDLGYGLVVANGGLSEMVSMFTYYCWTAYYAYNGSEIRSLNGSNANGEYGLVAEGADPNEIPDGINLRDNMVQPVRLTSIEAALEFSSPVTVAAGERFVQASTGATGIVCFDTENNNVVYLKDLDSENAFDTSGQVTIDDSSVIGVPTSVDIVSLTNAKAQQFIYVYDAEYLLQGNSEIEIVYNNIISRYEVSNLQKQTDIIIDGYIDPDWTNVDSSGSGASFTVKRTKRNDYVVEIRGGGVGFAVDDELVIDGADLGGVTVTNDATITVTEVNDSGAITEITVAGVPATTTDTPYFDGQVYKVNFATGTAGFAEGGLPDAIPHGVLASYRTNQNFVIQDIADRDSLTTRPSTALVWDEYTTQTYRTIAFNTTESTGEELPQNQVLVTTDAAYDYVRVIVDSTQAANSTYAGSGTTMGATAGDVVIAISQLSEQADIDRINRSDDMIFVWQGKVHAVANYTDRGSFATIEISDVADTDINYPLSGTGLAESLLVGVSTTTLRLGLANAEPGSITINISTCRATGHDFLNIGTGGFNSSNYPNVLLGAPRTPQQENEVQERSKGRVFYVSTDQDGFFRVGKFFTVDQGTGTVTFAASIALSNLDGIGFKRGVVVAEFSTDTAMTNNAVDIVPTQSAVRGYVNRRLGFDHTGNIVSNKIGSGALAQDGTTPFTGDMNAASRTITNLKAPSSDSDAATKAYVDSTVQNNDSIEDLKNVEINNLAEGDLIIATGKKRIYIDADTIGGTGVFAVGQEFTGSFTGAVGTIVDVEITTDSILGNINIIVYTEDSGTVTTQDIIEVTSGPTGQVVDGPFDEFGNTSFDVNSQVEFGVARAAGAINVTANIKDNSIINADVNASAAIAQSKLNLKAADTAASAPVSPDQSLLGVARFDSANFDATNGWIKIKDNGVALAELAQINENTVLGRTSSGTGAVETLGVTTSGEQSKLVRTQTDGSIRVNSIRLGGDNTYEVLSLSSTTLNVKTPAQGIVLTAEGATNPTVNIPGSVNIGSTGVTESTLQQASTLSGESRLAVDWIYSSFIEATGEKDATSTGISIGANTGKTNAGEVAVVVAGDATSVIPFKVKKTGFVPDVTEEYNIGENTLRYNTVYAQVFNGIATSAQYADLAENYVADAEYDEGTVLVFGGDHEVTESRELQTTRVAGVVSTNPAHLMNAHCKGQHIVAVALQGRVPVKVIGRVQKGDMLVASAIPGYAIVNNNPKLGSVIGKAVGQKQVDGYGTVEAVVGRV